MQFIMLIRYFGLAGVAVALLFFASQPGNAENKKLLQGLAAACFVAWAALLFVLSNP
jgi:hypothetical protein